MTDWVTILLKAFWCGWAALGFGILFNVPVRNLYIVWIGGAIAGFIKFGVLLFAPVSVILASFLASLTVGIFSTVLAHVRHEPQMIFAIPSVIPLVPGVFAYRTMVGLVKLTGNIGTEYSFTLSQTVHDGVITLFIIMSIAIGVTIPIQISEGSTKKFFLKK